MPNFLKQELLGLTPMMKSSFYFIRFVISVLLLSSCNLIAPPASATPPPPCAAGQVSTEAEPCTSRPPDEDTDGDGNPDTGDAPTPGETPDGEDAPAPIACENATVTPRMDASILSSETSLKSCYAPGDAPNIFASLKLEDSTVTLVSPIIVFDIVRDNADGSTTSVAASLLDERPTVNPDILGGNVTREQLLAGLEAAVSLSFSESAPPGKYVMALSLFKDQDAFDPNNLVSRVFYDFEIK
jgi:hypothetical protein